MTAGSILDGGAVNSAIDAINTAEKADQVGTATSNTGSMSWDLQTFSKGTVKGSVNGATQSAIDQIQQFAAEGKTPAIGKMVDLNKPGAVSSEDYKVADLLPYKGNPQADWKQNSSVLKIVMKQGVPIKDVSPYPMQNAGFLGMERNLLRNSGWTHSGGYWYPPQ